MSFTSVTQPVKFPKKLLTGLSQGGLDLRVVETNLDYTNLLQEYLYNINQLFN